MPTPQEIVEELVKHIAELKDKYKKLEVRVQKLENVDMTFKREIKNNRGN